MPPEGGDISAEPYSPGAVPESVPEGGKEKAKACGGNSLTSSKSCKVSVLALSAKTFDKH